MLTNLSRAALLACAVAASVSAQVPQAERINLRYQSFDPTVSQPDVAPALRSNAKMQMHIVQFAGVPTQVDRDAIAAAGGKLIGYLPVNAYVVRMTAAQAARVAAHASVRWLGGYQPAYRLEPELLKQRAWRNQKPVRYNLVVADKHNDKPSLNNKIQAIGGTVDHEQTGSLLFTVTLTGPQLLQAAGFDEVLWIDRWTAAENDMDNARIQGGGNYVELQGGYTGTGVNTHVYEGLEATHPDFTGTVTEVLSAGVPDFHGHCTAGIVFGNGNSNPAVRGMAPDAGKFYTNYMSTSASRWQVFNDLVNVHDVSHSTASWGSLVTTFYTSVSADADDITFDHDLAWTQSQSNTSNQNSRPEAWAKNVFSIGGVTHGNNSNPLDDSWLTSSASTGPALDGRIKPTLCAYADNVGTSDLSGNSGYSSGNWTPAFNGTSSAAPIVAGHNTIALQMFTDEVSPGIGLFGQPLRAPGGTSHQNRPHFPTLKGLQVVNAAQYTFAAASVDNRREHQGWGFPNLQTMYDNRNKMYIVDETDIILPGVTRQHTVTVGAGEPSLKICLNWSEPAANPSATTQLINNLSLRVTAPNGTQYWGNNGLNSGLWSAVGGMEDTVNSIENVFVQNPQTGDWIVDVMGSGIVVDNHVETAIVDADYALVVAGGLGQLGVGGTFATKTIVGSGCGGTSIICDEAIYEYPNFDLANSSWSLDYSGGEYTLVAGAGTWINPVNAQGFGDDTIQTYTLPFGLPTPGGTSNSISVCANGWVTAGAWTGGSSWTPSVSKFLTDEMWCLMWRDLNPQGGGDVYVDSNALRAVITWDGVPNYQVSGSNTAQIQLWANGDVHVIYQNMTVMGDYLVGYSVTAAADPGPVDISMSLNGTVTACDSMPGTPDVALDVLARPLLGSTVQLLTTNVPLTAVAAASIFSFTPIVGGLELTFFGMPGCYVYQQLDVVISMTASGGNGLIPVMIPNNPALIGQEVQNQSLVLVPNSNPAQLVTSNGVRLLLGDI
ncbi:MAG: serine protease AprX [Hyphomicrobiaceae bacterium]|jgi:serine protease AprX